MSTLLEDLSSFESKVIAQLNSVEEWKTLSIEDTTNTSLLHDIGVVIYTDGSYNEGKAGFGLHGYIYKRLIDRDVSILKKIPEHSIPKSLPTDMGYVLKSSVKDANDITLKLNILDIKNNEELLKSPAKSEILCYFDICAPVRSKATNNTAELLAVIYALRLSKLLKVSDVHIRADSKLAISTLVSWAEKWSKSGWIKPNGEVPANLDIVKLMLLEKREFIKKDAKLTIEWVKGHSDFIGNIEADDKANRGRVLSINNDLEIFVKFSERNGYWKEETAIHNLLTEPRFYFTTAHNAGYIEGLGYVYHIGSHGKKDEQFGKSMADNNTTVVMLKEPDNVLERVRKATLDYKPFQDGSLFDCRLDIVSKPSVYNEIVKYGFKFVYLNKETHLVMSHDGLPVLRIPKAPHLSFRAKGYFVALENLLVDYMTNQLTEEYVRTDVTHLFYSKTTETKGSKTIEKISLVEAPDGAYKIPINYPGMKDEPAVVTLTYGIDIPRRLNLMRLATDIEKIEVMTWAESATSYRIVTFIITKNGECGVWAGGKSNLRFHPTK